MDINSLSDLSKSSLVDKLTRSVEQAFIPSLSRYRCSEAKSLGFTHGVNNCSCEAVAIMAGDDTAAL